MGNCGKSKNDCNKKRPEKCVCQDNFLASYFDELEERVDLVAEVETPVASVSVGTVASPSRFLNITGTYSASADPVPKFVDFFIRVDSTDQNGGSESTFTAATLGQSGSIVRRVEVGPGVHTVSLIAVANAAGVSIDPVGRPKREHAAILVVESKT